MEMLQRVAEPLLGPLATAGIVVILVIFILLYREDLRDRLIRLAGARDLHRTMSAMDDAAYRLSRFFLAQTGMNTAFGLFIAAALWLIGIPNPLLWGFVAALMRFVPFIGVFVAVTGPLLLAMAVDPGWATLVWVLVLFAVSEMLMGQVFEPLVFGHSTGLSPIAVIAAATFWTWLWGPIGLLLAVPLTVCLVVLGRHVDRLEFLEVMLGDQPPLDPEETFYQRALAGDADALAEQAERCLKEKPLADYLDVVALPALRLAQADAVHGVLPPERREALQRSVRIADRGSGGGRGPEPDAEAAEAERRRQRCRRTGIPRGGAVPAGPRPLRCAGRQHARPGAGTARLRRADRRCCRLARGAAAAALPLPDRGRQQQRDRPLPAAPGAAPAARRAGDRPGLGAGARSACCPRRCGRNGKPRRCNWRSPWPRRWTWRRKWPAPPHRHRC